MAKPIGIARATKDNSKKHPHMREEWMQGKKIGRPKQTWVWDREPVKDDYDGTYSEGVGHWERA